MTILASLFKSSSWICRIILIPATLLVSLVVHGETTIISKAEINWVRASDSNQHICTVKLNVDIETEGAETIGCSGSTVAVQCGGTIDGVPSRTFDLVLFAFENRRKISLRVDDQKKFDDVCYATRICVTRELAACTDDDDDDDDDCDAYRDDDSSDGDDDDPSSDDDDNRSSDDDDD